jgi:sugar/nucleoside kinase (ribokinase family)
MQGQVDWRAILRNALPYVDIFIPSVEELTFMLRREMYEAVNGDVLPILDRALLESLTDDLLAMGCGIVGLKLSHYGMYLRGSADNDRLSPLAALGIDVTEWLGITAYHPAYQADVVGTTGAGDAAYAGVLAALLHGFSPSQTAAFANAVGRTKCEPP